MKHIIWTALAALAASIGLALFAGKDDIRRLYRMRRVAAAKPVGLRVTRILLSGGSFHPM
jgi:hypothetical protein